MATPKQLVEKISELTGVPIGTVTLHDRNLLVAGLRSEGQRGRGKSVVTYQDAANLLIALAGSRNVKDSAETVRMYSPLVADAPLDFEDGVRGETFGDALAALIEALPNDRESYRDPEQGRIQVNLFGPDPGARIEWVVGEKSGLHQYGSWASTEPSSMPDLTWVSGFTQVTIGHVGEMIKGDTDAKT